MCPACHMPYRVFQDGFAVAVGSLRGHWQATTASLKRTECEVRTHLGPWAFVAHPRSGAARAVVVPANGSGVVAATARSFGDEKDESGPASRYCYWDGRQCWVLFLFARCSSSRGRGN